MKAISLDARPVAQANLSVVRAFIPAVRLTNTVYTLQPDFVDDAQSAQLPILLVRTISDRRATLLLRTLEIAPLRHVKP